MCLGIPGQVVEIRDPVHHIGVVSVEGVRREISLALLSDDGECAVAPGTWVLVHVGFAMARIDEVEAAQTLAALRALGDVYANELTDLSRATPLESAPLLDAAPLLAPTPAPTPAPTHGQRL